MIQKKERNHDLDHAIDHEKKQVSRKKKKVRNHAIDQGKNNKF